MTLVYRVETTEGSGPYAAWPNTWGVVLPRDSGIYDEVSHPLPEDDGLGYTEDGEKFAFSTVEQFMDWFGFESAILTLEQSGFFLNVYDIPPENLIVGGRQVKYINPDSSQFVVSLSLIDTYYSNIHFSVDIIEHDE